MTWPELEVYLSDKELDDLVDEWADEPQESIPSIVRARMGTKSSSPAMPTGNPSARPAMTGGPASGDRSPSGPNFTKPATASPLPVAVTPRALGDSSRLQSGPRGVFLLRCQCPECDRGRQWLDGRSCQLEAPD